MAIKINLKDNLFLESDGSHNFMIKKYGTDEETGEIKESSTTLCYHGNIEHSFNYAKNRKLLGSDATSFEELINVVKDFKAELKDLVRETKEQM